MKWQKLGLIFNPQILEKKKLTAALMPIAQTLHEEEGRVRLFFSPRDQENRSQVHFFDICIDHPTEILNLSDHALLLPGKLGAFDDSGITLGSLISYQEKIFLYYTGWNLTVSVPMNNSIGLAELGNDKKFHRLGDGPIMTRNLKEPYSCASPFVLYDEEKSLFKMWYASNDKWERELSSPKHYYNIKYAESVDGINWKRDAIVAINYQKKEEYAFGRPFVLKEKGIYKMWYSFRGDYYRIGYAESQDGKKWQRKDHLAGLDISSKNDDFDSEMVTYPFIWDNRGKRYMFYNGNGYGKSGIGLAILQEE